MSIAGLVILPDVSNMASVSYTLRGTVKSHAPGILTILSGFRILIAIAVWLFALTVMYSVPFDVSAESGKVVWLDLCLHTEDLRWTMKPVAWTFPPPWGAPTGYAHSFLCGPLRRWSEVPLDFDAWLDAAARVLIGFRDAKWSKRAIRAAAYKAARHCSRSQHGFLLRLLNLIWQ